ncbi:MAG: 30S ribosomal protein S6, partial [Thermomicrobiales bacterium]
MRDANERVRKYELMVIFSPDVAEEELPAAIDKVSGFVSTFGGTVTTVLRDSPWGRRRLAYPIRFTGRDIRDGFYVLYYFDADSLTIVEIERELKLFDRVMRHMLIIQVAPLIVPEAPQAPAPTPAADGSSEPTAPVEAADAPAAAVPASTIEPEAEHASPIDDAANVA